MNDKLQIRDLVAMLTAPGIDPCAYVEICGDLDVGLHKQTAVCYCLGTTNIEAQMEEAEIESYEEGEQEGVDALRSALDGFLDESETDRTTEEIRKFLKDFAV